jgi:hypothetical protein
MSFRGRVIGALPKIEQGEAIVDAVYMTAGDLCFF